MIELKRLPALDGLRAVAVYLVVAFHAGVGAFEGGFIGVDVFFVLSGFLITRLLIVEYAGTGRVGLLDFYARRVRRLLPAAWVALLVTAAAFVAFSNPLERSVALDDARAAVFYVANWHFIGDGQDYFAESITSSPFLHLWSLAVEEQFYVVWPLAALVLLRLWRRSPMAVTGAVAGFAVLGVLWARWVAGDDLLRAYYGTDTRAYQLLTGAAIAFVLSQPDGGERRVVPRFVTAVATATGLAGLVVAATIHGLDAVDRGIVATALTAAIVIGLAGRVAGDPTAPESLLGSRPAVRLGNLSYATYLWHWPIVVLLERTLVLGSGSTVVIVAAASTGIAHLSMDLVEGPVRRRSRGATRRANAVAVGTAVAGAVLLGLFVAPAVFEADVAQVRAADRVGFVPPPVTVTVPAAVPITVPSVVSGEDGETAPPTTIPEPTIGPVPPDLGAVAVDSQFGERDGCVNVIPTGLDDCVVLDGSGTRVMLIGDSHASKLNIAFAEHAAANDLAYAVVTSNGCAWQRALSYATAVPVEAAQQACRDQRDVLYERLVVDFAPDVVVAVSHSYTEQKYGVIPRAGWSPTAGLDGPDLIEAATRQAADTLTAGGATLVIMEPIPNAPFDVAGCLSGATLIEECQFVVTGWPPSDSDLYRQVAADRPDVRTADMTTLSCPAYPVCSAIVDGVQVREDRDHLYGAYVLRIGPAVMERVGV